mgnify:CR=1 FL=1
MTCPRDRYLAAQLLPELTHRYPDLTQVIRVTRVRRCSLLLKDFSIPPCLDTKEPRRFFDVWGVSVPFVLFGRRNTIYISTFTRTIRLGGPSRRGLR